MKYSVVKVFCIVLFLGLVSCKDKETAKTATNTEQFEANEAAMESHENQQRGPVYKYVMVPSGLSLRKSNTLDSEKLAGMPFRSRVEVLEERTETAIEVEHIKGGMHKIKYEDKVGYAFSGFLSQFPMPQEEEEGTDAYIAKLKENFSGVNYKSKSNDPDFHEGMTYTYTLPAASWSEAYYLAAAMFQFPTKLGFPGAKGADMETIEDPEKDQDTWDSFLTVEREKNKLKKINFSYRAEGYGYGIDIIRKSDELFQFEHLAFVD